MKKLINKKILYIFTVLVLLLSNSIVLKAQEDEKEESERKFLMLGYYNNNNQVQYLMISASLKNNEGVQPQKNKEFKLYLDSYHSQNLIATVKTDNNGRAKAFLPTELKDKWDAASKHTFLAVADEGTEEEQSNEIEITKSKIIIDTLNEDGIRSITAQVMKLEEDKWVPVPDVELKIGIKRLGGIISAGDDATYTTDSSGSTTVEIAKADLPGDENGNYVLAVKVEDNDELGNLLVEKTVGWGVPAVLDKSFFDRRTLWTTRNRTPVWLLIMAYSIVLAVWGTLIYLIVELIKIKKLGKTVS